jgi:hypothetical protein
VKRAVVEDVNGNYKSAVKLYCESLEHFVPAIHCKLTIYFSPSKYISVSNIKLTYHSFYSKLDQTNQRLPLGHRKSGLLRQVTS